MSDIWEKLQVLHEGRAERSILSRFDDPNRFEQFSATFGDMVLDYSKTSLDEPAMDLLIELAQNTGVEMHRDAMFRGDKINRTENRAVLHTALRSTGTTPIMVDGENVVKTIAETRLKMENFANQLRAGGIVTAQGKSFTDIVSIGIGGSDLGPVMAVQALSPYHDGPNCHFVSNIDAADIHDTLAGLDPARTLIIIVSKSFTTIETITNAKAARNWLREKLGDKADTHLAAVSSDLQKTGEFGIDPARVFGFGDYIGGRYSVWGPVGLSLMLAIGPQNFTAFLAGGHAMDQHFKTAPLGQNLPVLLGLTGIWHNNICGFHTRAILPYDQRLARLPAFLQQLDMESNGKHVDIDGNPLKRQSGPIVWGEAGTNGQHAFYQLLHQGTAIIPSEFLIAAEGHEPTLAHQHNLLKANCLAQSQALMRGRDLAEARMLSEDQAPHREFSGNRPSVTLAYKKLTPHTLGQIIALYEHRVFVEGIIWGLNSFDQWGVELGKELAANLLPMVNGTLEAKDTDGSTRGLLAALISKP